MNTRTRQFRQPQNTDVNDKEKEAEKAKLKAERNGGKQEFDDS